MSIMLVAQRDCPESYLATPNNRLVFHFVLFSNFIQHFPVIREELGTLIGTGGVAVLFRHEGADKRRELVNAAFVFNAVIGRHLYNTGRM